MADAPTEMSDTDLRLFAMSTRDYHTPRLQADNPYGRCALCHYTRHPCDVYDLASYVLALLDRLETP